MHEPGLNKDLVYIHFLEIFVMSFTLMLHNAHLLLVTHACHLTNMQTNNIQQTLTH